MFIYRAAIWKYCIFFNFFPVNKKIHTRAKLPNSKLHFVITGRQHKAPVKVSAASAVPRIYIALCIGIANKETIGTICHSFIAVGFFFPQSATYMQPCHLHICMQDKLSIMSFLRMCSSISIPRTFCGEEHNVLLSRGRCYPNWLRLLGIQFKNGKYLLI